MADAKKFPCDVYIDESSEGLPFTVIGGVIVPSTLAKEIDTEIQSHKKNPSAEFKWNGLDNRNGQLYQKLLQTFLERRAAKKLHFHCIVIENDKVDYDTYSFGDVDLGFNKFAYRIVLKFGRLYSNSNGFYVYPDERRTRQTGDQFREVLNNGAAIHREIKRRPFKIVEFRKSHLTPLIQLADVLIGAIAYEANGHHLQPNACKAKVDFLNTLKTGVGAKTFKISSPYGARTFSIWYLDFSKAGK